VIAVLCLDPLHLLRERAAHLLRARGDLVHALHHLLHLRHLLLLLLLLLLCLLRLLGLLLLNGLLLLLLLLLLLRLLLLLLLLGRGRLLGRSLACLWCGGRWLLAALGERKHHGACQQRKGERED